MAAAKKLWSKDISDITECPICVETFTDPKVLPCGHTFCLKCLLKYIEHEEAIPGDEVACPLCRANFVTPHVDFANLPNNFFVDELLLANQPSEGTGEDGGQECDICKADAILANATAYCIECNEHYCDKCCRCHEIMRVSRSHKIVSLKKRQLDDDIEKVTSCAQQSRDKLQQLERDSKGFLESVAATQQAISAAYEKLKSLLDSHRSQLMEELNTIKTKRLKEIECQRDKLEHQCMVVESFKKYCQEMKEKGTASDISRAANDLHTRSAELVKAQEQCNRQQLDRVELTFTPTRDAWCRTVNLIGVLAEHQSSGL